MDKEKLKIDAARVPELHWTSYIGSLFSSKCYIRLLLFSSIIRFCKITIPLRTIYLLNFSFSAIMYRQSIAYPLSSITHKLTPNLLLILYLVDYILPSSETLSTTVNHSNMIENQLETRFNNSHRCLRKSHQFRSAFTGRLP